jgi:lysophospholipase L1-like esterase
MVSLLLGGLLVVVAPARAAMASTASTPPPRPTEFAIAANDSCPGATLCATTGSVRDNLGTAEVDAIDVVTVVDDGAGGWALFGIFGAGDRGPGSAPGDVVPLALHFWSGDSTQDVQHDYCVVAYDADSSSHALTGPSNTFCVHANLSHTADRVSTVEPIPAANIDWSPYESQFPFFPAGSTTGNAWTYTPVPPRTDGSSFGGLNSVSCAAPTACMAVGNENYVPIARRWDGVTWTTSAVPAPNPGGAVLIGVSCPGPSDCHAVGYFLDSSDGNRRKSLVEHWDGLTWNLMASPTDLVPGHHTQLIDVSCSSPSFCMAVGETQNPNAGSGGQNMATWVEEWNGQAWTMVSSVAKDGWQTTHLTGVSCVSADFCAAVGTVTNIFFGGGETAQFIQLWDGSAWSESGPEHDPYYAQQVSCISAQACVAVGPVSYRSGIGKYWDGTSWTSADTPDRPTVSSNAYGDVSCTSPTACVGVGIPPLGSGRWDGTHWGELDPPVLPTGVSGAFDSVDCPTADFCVSVGIGNGSESALFAAVLRAGSPPPPPNRPPAWASTVPIEGSRFDIVPGKTGAFTLAASDPDGDPLNLTVRYETVNGLTRSMPSFVSCTDLPASAGNVSRTCGIRPPNGASDLSIARATVTDSHGATTGTRSFLVGASSYKYVALGDSFSAGEGIEPFLRDGYSVNKKGVATQPGTIDNRCHRSTQAYAELVKPRGYQQPLYVTASGGGDSNLGGFNKYGSDQNVRTAGNVTWAFLACSGAVTDNVLPGALGGHPQDPAGGYREIRSQLDYPIVDYGTDLVTITIGGNDVRFPDVLSYCAQHNCNTPEYAAALDDSINLLRPELVKVYNAIRAKTFNARIVVLGYPQLFPALANEQLCSKLAPWRGEQDMLREKTTRLNSAIEAAALTAGVEYRGVATYFSHHEVCGDGGEWINAFTGTPKKDRTFTNDQSFHPNAAGQRLGYAQSVNDLLG